ncbi:flagellar hook-length control protein FliK [Comamonas antarctica]|uniref:Flagellar hook-length control protein FliK n=2 Tax=Comamonas antarctica TaxID=2743470 RepID=A0A6N1X6U4_9BURK|nr:flagellar hook-length control protein FliK [Comamonas antarctica]
MPGPASAAAQANGSSPATGPGGADSAAPLGAADAPATDIAADAVLAQPDDAFVDQLSEQVAFWVQQKTQRAEMTIDRQGQPVQVQVAITGNEAHVTFRSNEQQTRDMLDASMAQLREMLEQQGLNLAGVTVQSGDAGGQGAPSGRDPSDRPVAEGRAGIPQTAQVTVDLRARPDATRSVDLFV